MSVLQFLALFRLVFQFLHFKSVILLSGFGVFCSLWCFLFLAFGVWQKYKWFLVSDAILIPSQRWSLTDLVLNPPSTAACQKAPANTASPYPNPIAHDRFIWTGWRWLWLVAYWVFNNLLYYNIAFHYNAANDFYFQSSDRYIRFCQWKNVELNINVRWHLSLKCVNMYLNQDTMYRMYLQSL